MSCLVLHRKNDESRDEPVGMNNVLAGNHGMGRTKGTEKLVPS